MADTENRVQSLWAEYAPRIKEAEERVARSQTLYFCSLVEEHIGDFPAVPLTLERYLILVHGGVFEDDDSAGTPREKLIRFLWVVNPEFVPEPKAARRFAKLHAKIDVEEYGKHTRAYSERMFGAWMKSTTKEESKETCWVAGLVDTIAHQYGWTEEAIMQTAMPRLIAYTEKIRARVTGNSTAYNSEADDLREQFMKEANRG